MDNTNHTCLVSVIVPVYNTQLYIERCLDSILNQSYKLIELIIINDGSTDGSDEAIRTYCQENSDRNIKYLSLPLNIGAGNARNKGAEIATGKYISFIDSDDWIDSNFVDQLINVAERTQAEITISGMKTEFNNSISSHIRHQYSTENVVDGRFALQLLSKSCSQDCYITPIVCNKVYNRDFLKKAILTFECSSYFEDDIFTFLALAHAHKIALVPNVFFHYYQRDDSIMHSFSLKYIDDLLDAFFIIRTNLEKQNSFSRFKEMYISFFEKCTTSMLHTMVETEQNAVVQKSYVKYLIGKFIELYSVDEYVDYLGMDRILAFWGL